MRWLRENLFCGWVNSLLTLLLVFLAWKTLPAFIDWAFLEAVWRPEPKACAASEGACWGFVAAKHRFILFGTYPYAEHWRPALATAVLIGLWVFSLIRRFWRPWLALVWVGGLAVIGSLMWG
jgi:general L-amino acid transport system permease protein